MITFCETCCNGIKKRLQSIYVAFSNDHVLAFVGLHLQHGSVGGVLFASAAVIVLLIYHLGDIGSNLPHYRAFFSHLVPAGTQPTLRPVAASSGARKSYPPGNYSAYPPAG